MTLLEPNQSEDNPYTQYAPDPVSAGTAAGQMVAPADGSENPYAKYAPKDDLAPITDTGTTMGFADEAPLEASNQLSKEDEAALIELARHPATTADDLRRFAASKGHAIANADEVIAARDKGLGVNGSIAYPLPKPAAPGTATDAFGRGVLRGGTLNFVDEMQGAAAGLGAALHGDSFGAAYDKSVDETRGQFAADEEQHPYADISGQLLGGLIVPVGLERAGVTASVQAVGLAAGRDALRSGATMAEARAIAQSAITRRLAVEGAAYGGAYGAGSGESPGERLVDAAGGAAAGAVGGAALGGAGEALAPRIQSAAVAARALPMTDAERTAAAAGRQGIDILPADVGGPTTRRLTAAAAQAPISAAPIINAGQETVAQARGLRDSVAQAIGRALNPEQAGQGVIAGVRSFIARTSARGNALYRNAENLAGNARVTPTNAIAVLDQHIAELGETPGGSAGIERLQGLRDALSQGDFSIRGIRNMRTALRDDFTEAGLRGSDIERRVNQVIDAASSDIETALASDPNALRAYRTADRYWRNRVATIDDHLEPIVGKDFQKSGKQVIAALKADMNGNSPRLFGFLRALEPQERNDAVATLISGIGRATKGAQNDRGDAFSLQTFLSNYDDLTQSLGERGKARLFGPEGRAALNDLAAIANGTRQAQTYANKSNTAGGIWGNIGALFGLGSVAPHAAAAGLITQLVGGRLLASPRFARWIARAPRTSLGAAAYVDRLSRIAAAEPAIANDVLALQRHLEAAFVPHRAAADSRDQDRK